MKTNLYIRACLTLLALALAGAPAATQAQTPATPPTPTAPTSAAPATPKPEEAASYEGTISAINGNSVTVTTATGTLTLAITSTTKIAKAKKTPGKMSDFAVGDKVKGLKGHYTTDASGAMSATKFYKVVETAAPAAP